MSSIHSKLNLKKNHYLILIVAVAIVLLLLWWFYYNKMGEGFQVSYSSYPTNTPLDSGVSNLVLPNDTAFRNLSGLQGLFGSTDANQMIDPFYGSQSSMSCQGSGLMRSGGNVCLDANQTRLLTTRGGNAGYNAEIGK